MYTGYTEAKIMTQWHEQLNGNQFKVIPIIVLYGQSKSMAKKSRT